MIPGPVPDEPDEPDDELEAPAEGNRKSDGGVGTATGGLPELDPVVHAQPRLRIAVTLTTLGPGDQMTFPRLQELVGMTPGNLSTHLRKLEDAGYIAVEKAFRRRTPVTWLSITRTGRRALEDYTSAVHQLLATTRAPAVPPPDHHSPRDGAP